MKINKQLIIFLFILAVGIFAYSIIPSFEREEFNPELVRYLWKRADVLGLDAFDMTPQYAIYDDHVPLYQIAGIPAIDLIDFKYPNPYANFWHTMDDTPENCSAESLGQVGRLMVDYIYYRENQNW